MTSLFLSHSSRDRKHAAQVRERLRAKGYQALFLDFDPSDGIPAGSNWERELYGQLRRTDGVVFLASSASIASRWCFAEISLARLLGYPVFAVRVEDGAGLDLLKDVQWVDLAEGDTAFARLFRGLRRAGLDPADGFAWDPTRSPYPGLASFDQQDAAVFFGRKDEINELMKHLRTRLDAPSGRFVGIVGPSGSGKSSLLRAGLLPRLGREPHRDRWVVLPALLPGRDPVGNLAAGLASAYLAVVGLERRPADVARELADGPQALVEMARELGEADGGRRNVLVVIDQAEELVTRCGPQQQQEFLSLLRGALHADSPLWVVATLRPEYLSSDPDRAGLAEAIRHPMLLEPLSRARLPEVIQRPAKRAGLDIDQDLIGRMVEDTTGGDALPLLAFTLRRLYQVARREGRMTIQQYKDMGGVVGALRGLADEVRDDLERQGYGDLVLPTLLNLTNIDESGEPTRRRIPYATLSTDERVVVQAFTHARLLTTKESRADVTVEVAHEALLRQWPPLQQAIKDAHQDLRVRSDLERLANDWEQGDHDESYLLRGGRLQAVEDWADRHPGELGGEDSREVRFLRASQALAHNELRMARERQRVATGRSLLYQAESLRDHQAGLSLLLGIAAMSVNPSPEARRSLITTLLGNHYLATVTGHDSEVSAVAFSPDGRTMVTGGLEPSAVLWDVSDPAHPRQLSRIDAHTGTLWALLFSPDGSTLVTAGPDSMIMLWDVTDLANPRHLSTERDDPRWISSAAFSRDGRVLLTGVWDNTGGRGDKAIVWDVSDRSRPRRLATLTGSGGRTGPVRAVALSPDGRTAFTGNDDSTVIAWDITDPGHHRVRAVLDGHANSVWAMAVSPDGATLVTAGADQTAILWDVSDPSRPERLSSLNGHSGTVRAAAFSPDGRCVATGSWDHTAMLWDIGDRSRPVRRETLGGHSQAVFALAFNPDRSTVATASSDHTTVVWNTALAAHPSRLAELTGHDGDVPGLAFSPDGGILASAGVDHTARLWDVADPARPRHLSTLSGHHDTVFTLAFSPDATLLATGSTDSTAILWDVSDSARPRKLSTLATHHRGVASVSFSPDGRTVATGNDDATATLWDIADPADPRRLATLRGHQWPVRGVPFSPDGHVMVTGSTDTTTIVWDVSDRAVPRRLATLTDDNSVYAARFSPRGTTLALAEEGRKTTLWDLSDPHRPERLVTVQGHASSVYTAGFSSDGSLLATGGYDKTVIVWDITEPRSPRELVTLAGHPQVVGAAVFSPTRPVLAVAAGSTPVLWDVSRLAGIVSRPVEVARTITGRGLTEQEWGRYAPDLPYQRTW
ncbi:nSTAND1 domain-containing NTPase [Streptomyces aurantiogriseus]|uniref:TIR domain-containing protein n=1 Tax=Streptomyces aurantiogriseus TaxID=66870 RepID=A0A918FL74_9ACTN|nr:TIR domain-containing protein [Streptomyces aurantiogriseus]GGR49024.1 hypothetical protein GCM10010251_77610 [Streptomyces aurantiogriseus]